MGTLNTCTAELQNIMKTENSNIFTVQIAFHNRGFNTTYLDVKMTIKEIENSFGIAYDDFERWIN